MVEVQPRIRKNASMSLFARLLAALLALLFVSAGAFAAGKPYANDDLASASIRLERKLTDDSADLRGHVPLADLRKQAQDAAQRRCRQDSAAARRHRRRRARQRAGLAAVRPRLARRRDAKNDDDADQLKDQAQAAAFAAYRHARGKTEEAAALALVAEIFAAREAWRDALNAYRASLDAFADCRRRRKPMTTCARNTASACWTTRSTMNPPARASVSSFPRIFRTAAPISRPSSRSPARAAPPSPARTARSASRASSMASIMRSRCARACPPPSAKTCCAPQDYDIYVRDRSPQARFTGRNYVLPRVGPEGVPVVSVNTAKVKVEIFRIGDRNLLPTIRSERFPRPAFRLIA